MKSKPTFFLSLLAMVLVLNFEVSSQPNRPSTCDFKSDMRKLWEDHIVWTRNVIFNILDSLPGTTEAVGRLLQNQDDIGNAIKPFYGVAAGNALTALLYGHINTAADVLIALHTNNNAALTTALAAWYANGDSIAQFLAAANPNWPLAETQDMMNDHLDLTTAEAVARHTQNYAADVTAYDAVHDHILMLADFLSEGIVRQFRHMFSGPSLRPSQDVVLDNNNVVLLQNYPNPFDESTVVYYFIPENVMDAKITFTDAKGNVIKTVTIQNRGEGSLNVFAPDLRKGIYTYSIVADGRLIDSKQMIH
jgi:hypothetical protein